MSIPLYSIELVTAEDALANFQTRWDVLSETTKHPNPFLTYGWFRGWNAQCSQEYRRGELRPHIIVVKKAESVVGVAPLIQRTSFRFGIRFRKLQFVTDHSDYNDMVVTADTAGQAEAVVDFLCQTQKGWELADFRNLRDIGKGRAHIEEAIARANLFHCIVPEPEGCPYFPINADAATKLSSLSGDGRRTLRRRLERATNEGLRSRIIENPQQEPGLLEKLIALDRQKQRHRSSPMFVGEYPEVFQSLFDTLGPRGWLYVALLELENRPVAFQLGFRCGSKLWDYTKAYDRSFSRFAPGTLLVKALIEYGFRRGYLEYDFLRGEELYKTVWSTGCHRQYRLLIWNRRWMSQFCAHSYLKLRVRPQASSTAERPT